MKYLITSALLIAVLFFTTTEMLSQEIKKYDYLEVIVIQKANNSGKIKRIKVQEQESLEGKTITIDDIEDIKGTCY